MASSSDRGRVPQAEEAADDTPSSITPSQVAYARTAPPKDTVLKCEGISDLFAQEFIESDPFESGGFKWRLKVYPKGKRVRGIDTDGFISVYLNLEEDYDLLSCGWEVNVILKIFLYDKFRDQYYTMQDCDSGARAVTRFHAVNRECGFPRFLLIDAFLDPTNGFEDNNSCIFGAEVFVLSVRNTRNRIIEEGTVGEVVSCVQLSDSELTYAGMIKHVNGHSFVYCHNFKAANNQWKLSFEHKGDSDEIVMRIHLIRPHAFVHKLFDWIMRKDGCEKMTQNKNSLYVQCTVKIINQHQAQRSRIYSVCHVFDDESSPWCSTDFLSLSDFRDDKEGLLANNTLAFEIKFENMILALGC